VRDDDIIKLIDPTGINPLRETRGEICPTKATYTRVDQLDNKISLDKEINSSRVAIGANRVLHSS
jgi:hypothetical protein